MNLSDVEVIRDVSYTEGGKRAALDIDRPRGVDLENAPVAGADRGRRLDDRDEEQQGLPLMNRTAERGWVCVAMNYGWRRSTPARTDRGRQEGDRLGLEKIASYGGRPVLPRRHGGRPAVDLAALAALTLGEPE